MPPWSDLLIHVVGFLLYLGALLWSLQLGRPNVDPAHGVQPRFGRAARLPIWALCVSVALGVFAFAEGAPVPGMVWIINAGAAVLFIRVMRRVQRVEHKRVQNHQRTEELRRRIGEVHDQRNQRYSEGGAAGF